MSKALVTYDSVDCTLNCSCGNNPRADGFYASKRNGTVLDPEHSGARSEPLWDGETMVCASCKSVFQWNDEEATKMVVGGDASHVQPVMVKARKIR